MHAIVIVIECADKALQKRILGHIVTPSVGILNMEYEICYKWQFLRLFA